MRVLIILLILRAVYSSKEATSKQTFQQRYHGRSKEDKVVGGSFVQNITTCPYQVSVQVHNQHVCGGSLLTLKHVFTACHCVAYIPEDEPGPGRLREFRLSDYKVLAGSLHIKNPESTSQERQPEKVYIHPKCGNERSVVFDLALARMSEPFKQTNTVKPVKMYTWDRGKFLDKLYKITRARKKPKCTVAGWGEIRRGINKGGVKRSDALKMVRMYPMRDPACSNYWTYTDEEKFKGFNFLEHGQICALNGMMDSADCLGDSGSPYVCEGQYLVGLVSFGVEGCSGEDPSVYSTVADLITWVKKDFSKEIDTSEPKENIVRRKNSNQVPEETQKSTKIKEKQNEAKSNQQNASNNPLIILILLLTRFTLVKILLK